MRLTPAQHRTIVAAACQVFGPKATVRLFGSRADDARRGGDFDLYVETEPNNCINSRRQTAALPGIAAFPGRVLDFSILT